MRESIAASVLTWPFPVSNMFLSDELVCRELEKLRVCEEKEQGGISLMTALCKSHFLTKLRQLNCVA